MYIPEVPKYSSSPQWSLLSILYFVPPPSQTHFVCDNEENKSLEIYELSLNSPREKFEALLNREKNQFSGVAEGQLLSKVWAEKCMFVINLVIHVFSEWIFVSSAKISGSSKFKNRRT